MDLYGPSMTALRAFSTKTTVVADNLANALTPGYKAQRVHMVEVPGGGVTVTISRDLTPGPDRPEPDGALGSGPREGSNVDLARESVNLITSQRFYQANARAFMAQAQTKGRIFDLIG